MPTTTITSWSSATSAVTPNFTSRKRNVIQSQDAERADEDQDERLADQVRR